MTEESLPGGGVSRADTGVLAMGVFVPAIRNGLAADKPFIDSLGLISQAIVSVGENELKFHVARLHDAVRRAFAGRGPESIETVDGEVWNVDVGKDRQVALVRGSERMRLPTKRLLSSSVEERLLDFEKQLQDANLPGPARAYWFEIVSKGSLTDSQLREFERDIFDTPAGRQAAIRASLEAGSTDIETLIPLSPRYYERLVGEFDQSTRVDEYANSGLRSRVESLIEWNGETGLSLALLLASHSQNSLVISNALVSLATSVEVLQEIAEDGDVFSMVGAVELCMPRIRELPALVPIIEQIVKKIRDDPADENSSRFGLLSALIVLVDGELARSKVFAEHPPFWRRLATISQASLIERTIVAVGTETTTLREWALKSRGAEFHLQTLIDMRREPRWHPDYVSPYQLRMEILGRLVSVAKAQEMLVKEAGLENLFFGAGALEEMAEFPYPYLPGPLEGGVEALVEMPKELTKDIERRLTAEKIDPGSFVGLVNSALVFKLDSEHANMAANAIRAAKYYLRQSEHSKGHVPLLMGLATVAGVQRSRLLAEELVFLVRNVNRHANSEVKSSALVDIGLMAASAFCELDEWSAYVGAWMSDLAFSPIGPTDARRCRMMLRALCVLEPALWRTCSKADAAFEVAGQLT